MAWAKGILISLLILLVVIPLLFLIVRSCAVSVVPGKNSAQHLYDSDRNALETVAQYLAESEEDWLISPEKSYGNQIDDVEVTEALDRLFDSGYQWVGKQGQTVYFHRWSLWKDFGAGLAYTVKDGVRPKVDYITGYEPLSQARWYYYETE